MWAVALCMTFSGQAEQRMVGPVDGAFVTVPADANPSPFGYKMRTNLTERVAVKSVPVVIHLHGANENKNFPDGWSMWEEKPFAASGKSYLFFKPASARWNPEDVDRFVEMIKTEYAGLVDPDRIYLTGFSMGGRGAWEYGIRHGDQLAGMLVMAGGFLGIDNVTALTNQYDFSTFRDLPVWIFHEESDKLVSTAVAEACRDAVAAVGCDYRWTLDQYGKGHGNYTGKRLGDGNVIEWLFSKHK